MNRYQTEEEIMHSQTQKFDKQPILKGNLLEMRPLHESHFLRLFEVAKDPLIWEQHPANDRWKESVFKNFFRESINSGGALIAIDKKTGNVIGSSRYHGYNEKLSEVEIGWTFLARHYWGGIYNGEMKRLMIDHAFKYVSNVVFLIGPNNVRSQKSIEKIGGQISGKRFDGNGIDSLVFRITKLNWSNNSQLKLLNILIYTIRLYKSVYLLLNIYII